MARATMEIDHKVIPTIREMATTIAMGIFRNEKLLEKCRESVDISEKDGEKRTIGQYVAIMAVDTAHWIDEYAKHWDNERPLPKKSVSDGDKQK